MKRNPNRLKISLFSQIGRHTSLLQYKHKMTYMNIHRNKHCMQHITCITFTVHLVNRYIKNNEIQMNNQLKIYFNLIIYTWKSTEPAKTEGSPNKCNRKYPRKPKEKKQFIE